MSDDQIHYDVPAREWQKTLEGLCRKLIASESSSDAREQFFVEYRNTCERVALRLLASWKWRGDIHRDAEDIASESTKILLAQEARRSGVFGSKRMDARHLYGYLTRTIWRSCIQIAMRIQPRKVMLSIDQLIEGGWEFGAHRPRSLQELRAELSEIFASLEASRSRYRKVPDELSLLDCLLAADMGGAGLGGIKKRTLQRYVKQIRRVLVDEFDTSNEIP